jgi:hypothetical protein
MGGAARGLGGRSGETIDYGPALKRLIAALMDEAVSLARDILRCKVNNRHSSPILNAFGVRGLREGGVVAPPFPRQSPGGKINQRSPHQVSAVLRTYQPNRTK